ncbi:MAG: hypothetical protein SFU91_11870 [Chloroherpetonaceae bacterium]|nr:hypothetical protein [Chloroherpetonaceae bacterium]
MSKPPPHDTVISTGSMTSLFVISSAARNLRPSAHQRFIPSLRSVRNDLNKLKNPL